MCCDCTLMGLGADWIWELYMGLPMWFTAGPPAAAGWFTITGEGTGRLMWSLGLKTFRMVSSSPKTSDLPGAGDMCGWTAGELAAIMPAFPVGVLGPPFPTECGPVAGEGTLM